MNENETNKTETQETTETTQQQTTEQQAGQQAEEKTFTQADVDRMIKDRLARASRETKQQIEAARKEGFSEAEKLAKMTEQQRIEHEREQAVKAAKEREESLKQREIDIARRELRATAVETLREKKLSVKLADVLDYSSADACNESINRLESVMREAIQEGVDARLNATKNPLKRGPSGGESALLTQVRGAMGLNDKTKKE